MLTNLVLLQEIDRFLRRSAMSESYFGHLAYGDTKLVARLRNGGSVTLRKTEQILNFIRAREITHGHEFAVHRKIRTLKKIVSR
jgi:hypothetical protein